MTQQLFPENESTYWQLRNKERTQKALAERAAKSDVFTPVKLHEAYEQSKVAAQEGRAEQEMSQEAWENSWHASMKLPPNDPRVRARKQKLINGGRA